MNGGFRDQLFNERGISLTISEENEYLLVILFYNVDIILLCCFIKLYAFSKLKNVFWSHYYAQSHGALDRNYTGHGIDSFRTKVASKVRKRFFD